MTRQETSSDSRPTVLYVPDVAKRLGVGISTARAFLVAQEARPGSQVQRRGRKLFIAESAFDALLAGRQPHADATRIANLERRVQRLAERLRVIEGNSLRAMSRVSDG